MANTAPKKSTLRFFLEGVNDHKIKIIGMFIGDTLQAIAVLLLPFVIRDLINAVQAYDPNSGQSIWDAIHTPFIRFIAANIFLVIFSRMSGMFLAFTAPYFSIEVRQRLIQYLQQHAFNYFQDRHSGALGNKIHQSIIGMRMALWTFVFDIWPVSIKFLFSVVLICTTDITMGLVLGVWSIVYFAVVIWTGLVKYNIITRLSNQRSIITGLIVDIASNIHTVKSFSNEEHEKTLVDHAMKGEIKENTNFQYVREGMGWFYSIMTFGLMIGLIYMVLERYATGQISVGDIAFVFSLILLLVEQCRGLSFTFSHFLEYLGQLRDGIETIMQTHTLCDDKDAQDIKVKDGHIEMRHMSFSYQRQEGDPVFSDLSLNIPAGQKLGLVGASGAGKSTLVTLLMRFYDLDSGEILIDGQNISKVTQNSLRNSIAVIPQDTSLFHRSLMDNIRYGKLDASDTEVIEASKQAHMHDFIMQLPKQYDTMVGERGLKLSGGQRQRIAIARAILKDAPILILDEATSALDSESELLIQESLKGLMKNKTVIAIAHRLSTIASLDRLIVMKEGAIIEDGTHNDLLVQNGLYTRLWSMQSGGFLKE